MGMNGLGGADMAKMLQMMMPYMDPSTKRMMSIMMKLQELKSLMEPLHSEKQDVKQQQSNRTQTAQPQKEEMPQEEKTPGGAGESAAVLRTMDDMSKAGQKVDLAAALQDGLTPEQQSMITSLSGMLK